MTIVDILTTLQEYYRPDKPLNETQVRIYMDTLDDIPVDLLDHATKHLIKTGHPFMPKVSELRTAASKIRRDWKIEVGDPLQHIPGAARTEADLDERYGTREEHKEICAVMKAEKYDELTTRQEAILRGG